MLDHGVLGGRFEMKKASIYGLVLVGLLMPSFVQAQELYAKVTAIMTDDNAYGGCMAALTPTPSTQYPSCGDPWVTFDCDGLLGTTKAQSTAKYSAAQLALVLGSTFYVILDTTRKQSSFCLATQVFNYPAE